MDDPAVRAVLFLEPSCWSSVADDWLQLKLAPAARAVAARLAAKAMPAEVFVGDRWADHPHVPAARPDPGRPLVVHGHCHQKALQGDAAAAAALRRISTDVTVLDAGCCGMAGSFGFTADRYDLSMRIGDLSLFPAVRAADPAAVVVAAGTSCRHQIHDGTGRLAVHPIEVLAHAAGP